MKKIRRNFRKLKRIFYKHFWWLVLAACLFALLVYGLSAFTAKPTIETITTHAPLFNSSNDQIRDMNNNQMHDVDFQPSKKPRKP